MHVLIVSLAVSAIAFSVSLFSLRKSLNLFGRLFLAGLTLAAVAGVAVLGTREDRKNEPVWQPGAISWTRMPLRIYWDGELFQDYNPQITQAIALWNETIGCEIFKPVPEGSAVDINLAPTGTTICGFDTTSGTPAGIYNVPAEAAASTYYCEDGTVDIQTHRLDDIKIAYLVFVHELGHAIGLAHDPSGIMSPIIDENHVPTLIEPSAKDIAAIKARYCGMAQ